MSNPLVSIIVPVYNGQDYVRTCLNSIVEQMTDDYEVIIVDDGSTDDSGKICREYTEKDSRFHYVKQANGGLSAARNTGMANSTGCYYFFLDGDDTIPQAGFSQLVELAKKTGADFIGGQLLDYYGATTVDHQNNKVEEYFGDEVKKQIFNRLNNLSACGKLIDRSLMEGITFPVGKRFEDAFTMPQVFFHSSHLLLTGQNVYYYWQRPGSTTHAQKSGYYLDWTEAYQQCALLVQKQCPEIYWQAQERVLQTYMRVLDLVMCWPHFRQFEEYPICRKAVKENFGQIMRSKTTRPVRKLYALGFMVMPDVIALLLRIKRHNQERKYEAHS